MAICSSCKKEYSCEGDGCLVKHPLVVINTYRDSLVGNGWDDSLFLVPTHVCIMEVISLSVSESTDIQGSTTMVGRLDDTGFNGKVEKPTHEFPISGTGTFYLMNRVQVFSDTIYNPTDSSINLFHKSNSYWTGDGNLKIADTTFLNVEYYSY